MIIIAIPIPGDLQADIPMVSCLTGLNVENVISVEQLQNDENKTYCRLFTKDGENLLKIQGEYQHGRNLFDIWAETADFSPDTALKKSGRTGMPAGKGIPYTPRKAPDIPMCIIKPSRVQS